MFFLIFLLAVCTIEGHEVKVRNPKKNSTWSYRNQFNNIDPDDDGDLSGELDGSLQLNPHPDQQADITYDLAYVREKSTEYILCIGTFLTEKHILTAASCLYGQHPRRLLVTVKQPQKTERLDVASISLHPDFEIFPRTSDIGVIKLKHPSQYGTVFALPNRDARAIVNEEAIIYGHRRNIDKDEEYLYASRGKILSRGKCSLMLRQYIDCDTICGTLKDLKRGTHDLGTPLAVPVYSPNGLEGKIIVGVYVEAASAQSVDVSKFESVQPYVEWIKLTI